MELFYDTETTGFPTKQDWVDPSQPHVIQLGWSLSTVDKIYSEGSILLTPVGPNEWHMSEGAERIHGISKEQVMLAGINAHLAAVVFCDLAKSSTIRVCHNTAFDQKIMTTLLKRAGLSADCVWEHTYCTMLNSIDLCKLPNKYGKNKWPKLQELHQYLFGERFEGDHDALEDVRATRRCYYAMKELGL